MGNQSNPKSKITSISLKNVATFSEETTLDSLKRFNFIFGMNASGKTTISRLIAEKLINTTISAPSDGTAPSDKLDFSKCRVEINNPDDYLVHVFNQDFVKSNFMKNDNIKGVFTLGKDLVEDKENIEKKSSEISKLEIDLSSITQKIADLDSDLINSRETLTVKLWKSRRDKYDETLKPFLDSLGDGRAKAKFFDDFLEKYRSVRDTVDVFKNVLKQRDLSDRAEALENAGEEKYSPLSAVNFTSLTDLVVRSSHILKESVVGKSDVDISAMIETLNNQDWVRTGVEYHEKNNHKVCPFCQQNTPDTFAQSLEKYFDDSYEKSIKEINSFSTSYAEQASIILNKLSSITNEEDSLCSEKYVSLKKSYAELTNAIDRNKTLLKGKIDKPSVSVVLEELSPFENEISNTIAGINAEITSHNSAIDNYDNLWDKLEGDVKLLFMADHKSDIESYIKKKEASEIEKAERELEKASLAATKKTEEEKLEALNQKLSGTTATVDEMNKSLASFGFTSFKLKSAEADTSYKLVREDGSDVGSTLSEGEASFVSFLYFYNLIKGSHDPKSISSVSSKKQIVVIDDPVSSLDSSALFAISSMVQEINSTKNTAQVFILTHNIYFLNDVTSFIPGKENKRAFFIILKDGNISKIEECGTENPVSSTYSLLWRQIRELQSSKATLGVMRQILEHYFKVLGGKPVRNRITELSLSKGSNIDPLRYIDFHQTMNDSVHGRSEDIYYTGGKSKEECCSLFEELFEYLGHKDHYDMMMESVAD